MPKLSDLLDRRRPENRGSFRWAGDEYYDEIFERLEREAAQWGAFMQGDIRRSINRGNVDGSNPSRPGEPPKKVTGSLQKAIGYRVISDRSKGSIKVQVGLVSPGISNARSVALRKSGAYKLTRDLETGRRKTKAGEPVDEARVADYAAALELGSLRRTKSGRQRLKPRPYLRPALSRNLPKLYARLGQAFADIDASKPTPREG